MSDSSRRSKHRVDLRMEIKINSHPGGVPETGGESMGSTYYSIHHHIVFSTKERRPLISSVWCPQLHEYLGGTVRGMGGVAEAVGGVEDHVHLLVSMKTTDAPADLVRELKKASSLWAKENHVSLFPLIRGYRKAQPPATISHPSGMKMEKLGN